MPLLACLLALGACDGMHYFVIDIYLLGPIAAGVFEKQLSGLHVCSYLYLASATIW